MAESLFNLLAQQESLLQGIHQGHLRQAFACLHSRELSPTLEAWLASQLKAPGMSPSDYPALPEAEAACWSGWIAYLAGDYGQALSHFMNCFGQLPGKSPLPAIAIDSCLGIGKVYTRSGQWQLARQWLLHALAHAREGNRSYDQVRCFGALGELFLRGSQPQDAFFCLSTAHHLLPPGAGERSRQLNYLASALMRLQTRRDQNEAQSLLMTSFHLALDHGNPGSACHSLARLQFLMLDRKDFRDISTVIDIDNTITASHDAVAKGFLAIARALAAWQRGDGEMASACTTAACSWFERGFPGELCWANTLACKLELTVAVNPWQANLPAMPPPELLPVADSLWLSTLLPEQGLAVLAKPPRTMASIIKMREVFFL